MRSLLLTLILTTAVAAQPAYVPPPQINPPAYSDPLDAMRKMQEIRNLQLQNARLKQDLERRSQSQQSQAAPEPAKADYLTGGLLNCRAWTSAVTDQRLAYIAAAREATLLLLYEVEKAGELGKYLPQALSNGEVDLMLTPMCLQPENRAVPVIFLYRLVAAKANGAPPDALERQAAAYRKIAAESK
jgi:hypothetical protein